MRVVYLTAGAAGMFCGSCMHDNSMARALISQGIDCLLQPVYTPIRTDEDSVADQRVFMGGIHVYLLQRMPWMKWLPRPVRGILDFPPLIRWATKRAGGTDPAVLGDLSVSMLRGAEGNQAQEFEKLNDWIANEIKPDAVVLTNLLIGGGLSQLAERLPDCKRIVMLQGDDIFLDHLPEQHRSEAIKLCTELVEYVDHFFVHSEFYGQKMGALLEIPHQKLVTQSLSIDLAPFDQVEVSTTKPSTSSTANESSQHSSNSNEFRIGYFARIAPEKGLHRLVEAFESLAVDDESISLHAAGWLGPANQPYMESIRDRLRGAGLEKRFHYHGSPDLNEKIAFMRNVDVLSVPTEYEDPKGLFVLESLAAGTPVVMPEHGAFGELVRSSGGGLLVPPDSIESLANAIKQLRDDPALRRQLAAQGQAGVREKHSIQNAARDLIKLIQSDVSS